MSARARAVLAFAADVAAVMVFAVTGRTTHVEGLDPMGLLVTAAPFLVALVASWALARAWRRPVSLATGVWIWAVTVAGGLALRAAATGRLPLAFALVTAGTLAVLLLGWRGLTALVRRHRGATV